MADKAKKMDLKGKNNVNIVLKKTYKISCKRNYLRIGTWNVRGTFEAGKLKHIISEIEKYKFDIVALQETKQLGQNIEEVGNCVFLNSGGTDRRLGTGFIVHKKLRPLIVDFMPVSDRLCTLRIRGEYQKITFVNVHAPTEEKNIEVKEEFYNEIDRVYDNIHKYDMKILLGDTNAKIGKEKIYKPTIGEESKHEVTNENGHLLIDFAKEKNIIIKSTYFQRKDIHKGTWQSPDGKSINQIDHIGVEKLEESCVKKIRTYRGPDADTDHFMVGMELKQTIPNLRNQLNRKNNYEKAVKLENTEEQLEYRKEIDKALNAITKENTIDKKWAQIKNAMIESTKRDSRKVTKTTKKWFDAECKAELETRGKVRLEMLQKKTEEAKTKYERQRRKTKRIIREKKRKFQECVLQEIEENYKTKQVRNLYQNISKERKGYQSQPIFYKNKDGNIITGEEDVLTRWKEFFKELLNEESPGGYEYISYTSTTQQEEPPPPSNEEIEEIVRKLKNNKSPGSDGITSELFKYGGYRLNNHLQELLNEIWKKEELPKEWTEAIICPIYKKGDKSECQNYRGIALLNVAYKILATYLKNKLIEEMEINIGEYQSGFRQGRSVIDQIFALREIQAESYEYNKPMMLLFIDFQKAYDSLKRKELYKTLSELGVNDKLIRLITITLTETENRVKINHKLSEKFEVKEGVRQGDPLSSVLFNLALEGIIRKANINRMGLIYRKTHQCLAYADDLVIIARSRKQLKDVTRRLETNAARIGLYFNEQKTKYMECTDQKFVKGRYLKIEASRGRTYNFEEVDSFTYLGTLFTRQPDTAQEIQARLMAGNRCVAALHKIMKSKIISRKPKVQIYKTVIRPIVTYASETWTLNKTEQLRLEVWERKVLRKVFGGTKVNYMWIRRTNEDLRALYGEPSITGIIKAQRLRWLGHVERMQPTRTPKMILTQEIGGKKRKGRPRKRWQKEVEDDIRRLKIKNWKEQAKNKKQWRNIVTQAMGLLGLKS